MKRLMYLARQKADRPSFEEYAKMTARERLAKRGEFANNFALQIKTLIPEVEIHLVIWLSGQVVIKVPKKRAGKIVRKIATSLRCRVVPYRDNLPVKGC